MKSITDSLKITNKKDKIGMLIGIAASLSGTLLWAMLNFFNPYSPVGSAKETIIRTFIGLCVPAFCEFYALIFRAKRLMYTAFIVSLPLSLYLAATPSIFKLFLLVSLGYLVSAILITTKVLREV